MRFSSEVEDPLSVFTRPPANETLQERDVRLSQEAEAQRVSDEIDEELRAERAAMKKRKNATKLLILGQSESGAQINDSEEYISAFPHTSTWLTVSPPTTDLQMTFAPQAWQTERASWRAVIQLNLVRAVNTILDTLNVEMASAPRPASRATGGITSAPSSPPVSSAGLLSDVDDDADDINDNDDMRSADSHTKKSTESSSHLLPFTSQHSVFRLSLSPLRRVEADLKTYLGAGSEEINMDDTRFNMATPFDSEPYGAIPPPSSSRKPQEFTVRSMSSWKSALGMRSRPTSRAHNSDLDSVTEVIAGCREDVQSLWQDGLVRELLRRKKVKLIDSALYYLENVERIARSDYIPSDTDVLRARLRTLGVQEHELVFENSADFEFGREWIIYDVGGSRTSRWAWLPYFDDANAILFLAPISCFDEHLTEDTRINRLQDTFILWKSIVSSKLLENSAVIIFMNKYDLLSRKLKAGAIIKDHLPSYGERENTAKEFSRYLKHQFKAQLRDFSPQKRPFYGFVTSVIDHKATAVTLVSVRDCILRDHLKNADFV
ncbi:hypothetical protein EIP91_007499 [Steccherinum ochraceum]|uniref:Guanine nucleotide-binding protein alpha-4 subunit n=1 Tax=Steccherinum ochraceum TaxID=92696 RepID=A0A4V6N720_9APHY|nr:hypothetical protein EIP91_007499 [Steccherinum ochraceum]